MDRNDLILVVAAALFAAFALGFLANWLVTRLSRVSKAEIGEMDAMAEQLHQAEEARDAAEAQSAASVAQMHNRLAQTEAELRAAMEGLREARQEAEELRRVLSEASRG
jgi:Sec-independent protein translocase protein TatA